VEDNHFTANAAKILTFICHLMIIFNLKSGSNHSNQGNKIIHMILNYPMFDFGQGYIICAEGLS